jgi:hypothetical protein
MLNSPKVQPRLASMELKPWGQTPSGLPCMLGSHSCLQHRPHGYPDCLQKNSIWTSHMAGSWWALWTKYLIPYTDSCKLTAHKLPQQGVWGAEPSSFISHKCSSLFLIPPTYNSILSSHPIHVHMKNEVFWYIAPCCWVCQSWYLEWSHSFRALIQYSTISLKTVRTSNLAWSPAYRPQQHNWCLLGWITLVLGNPQVDSLKRAAWLVFGRVCATYTTYTYTCLPACLTLHGAQLFLKRY